MLKRQFTALAFSLVVALGMPLLAQAKTDAPASGEPTIQQIYDAANGGKMAEADTMIAKVLKDHPNSAKAHFVQAELLAAQGKLEGARSALAKAKELAPDLSFAKREAVERLTAKLDRPAAAPARTEPARASTPPPAPVQAQAKGGSTPWLPIALVGLLAVGYLAFRRRVAPPTAPTPPYAAPSSTPGMAGMPGTPGGYPSYGPGGGNWMPPAAPAAAPGMGLGSALATGAAVGVGAIVAQEAVRHWMHDRSDTSDRSDRSDTSRVADSGNAEMGRGLWPSSSPSPQEPERIVDNDFGITDPSSWDDGSGGGGDNNDW
jgi:MYXO-CTERM domain-containing protein